MEAKYKVDVTDLTNKVKAAIQAGRDDLAGSFAGQLEQIRSALGRTQGQLATARAAFRQSDGCGKGVYAGERTAHSRGTERHRRLLPLPMAEESRRRNGAIRRRWYQCHQRLAIARTLANRPQIVLMDEPFGALDAQTRADMQQLLLRVWDETASTILFITHDVDDAIYLADRIFILSSRPGTIVEDIPVRFGRPRDPSVRQTVEFHQMQEHVLASLRRASGRSI